MKTPIKKLKYSYGFKTKAEKAALAFRKELGLTVHQALPAKELAEHLGIITLSQLDVPLSDKDLINLNSADDWSGASFQCCEKSVILYNCKHSEQRNESTIMHELSHIILEHKPILDSEFEHLGLMLRNYDEIHENEANWLGGCLQIPTEGIVSSLLKNRTPEQIAIQYNSSTEMANYRTNVSGAKKRVYYIRRKQA